MTLKLITAPATEPVTLAEAKLHLRIEGSITDEDDLVTALIKAAREDAEHQLGRALVAQTWERVLDCFPAAEIELGWPPVIAISSVTYIDAAGDSQTLASTGYSLDTDTAPGWLLPAYGTVWPATLDTAGAVRVRFTAGFGSTASDVPSTIKAWMLVRVGTLYQHRSQVAAGVNLTAMPGAFVDRLLDRYRVWGV